MIPDVLLLFAMQWTVSQSTTVRDQNMLSHCAPSKTEKQSESNSLQSIIIITIKTALVLHQKKIYIYIFCFSMLLNLLCVLMMQTLTERWNIAAPLHKGF